MVFLKERKKDDGGLTRQASDTPKDTPKEACRACGSVHLISGTFSLHPAQEAVQAIIVGYEAGEAALSGKKTALCPLFVLKMVIYQDRLGTNIGKALLKKKRRPFSHTHRRQRGGL